ncbi:MAG: endonuclease VIII [Anaerolineae bacterium]|nr:endonuclease VIII [Anaerolineae bacterium]
MFELPEYVTLAKQINETLKGKAIRRGQLGNSPHKFVWYNRGHDEFERLTQEKTIGEAREKGRWLFVPCEPGYVLLFGECGGKMLYHTPGSKVPKKYHLYIMFEDGSFFTVMTQMWGAIELYEKGQELSREYIKGMKPTPAEPEFTFDYFNALIDGVAAGKKQSVKGLLTQDQIIPGLGNAIAQDIMFRARLHPKHAVGDLSADLRRGLHQAILDTVDEIVEKGGRYDEYDLYGNPGQYTRLMDKNAVGNPCPECGSTIEKMQYLGGACYFCPSCQK